MVQIVDKRSNGSKSSENRQKFLHRIRHHIKKSIPDIIAKRGITEAGKETEQVRIPTDSLKEPSFSFDNFSDEDIILPGNKRFVKGDHIQKPGNGGSDQPGNKAGEGESEDSFIINLNREEFLKYFFDDLELPDLVQKELINDTKQFKWKNAGWQSSGSPSRLSVVKSMKNAFLRKVAMSAPYEKALKEDDITPEEFEYYTKKIKQIPFLDTHDLRYHLNVKEPIPITAAVMFAVMDVSASMGEHEKTIARKFFYLLYRFLLTKYQSVEIVFIQHTDTADIVSENDFFGNTVSGGTKISSALELLKKTILENYPSLKYNIYAAQVSDGDNTASDNVNCFELLKDILKISQHYFYIQIGEAANKHNWAGMVAMLGMSSAWATYDNLSKSHQNMTAKFIEDDSQIWPVFTEIFTKKVKKAA